MDFADLAMNHQSFQAGIEMIDSELRLQPAAQDLYLARGVMYVQMAQYDKAQADFDKAEQLDPRQGLSAVAQGLVADERDQSDPDKALAAVHTRLQTKPGDGVLWYLQAAILSQKAPDPGSSEFAQGLASAKKAVALDPSLTAAHNVLAKYYLDAGQDALAAKAISGELVGNVESPAKSENARVADFCDKSLVCSFSSFEKTPLRHVRLSANSLKDTSGPNQPHNPSPPHRGITSQKTLTIPATYTES